MAARPRARLVRAVLLWNWLIGCREGFGRADHPVAHGSTTSTPVPWKSRTFRVTRTAPRVRDMAVGLANGPTRLAAAGSNFCIGSGRSAFERQNPLSEAKVEPPTHGSLQRVSSSARRQDRDAEPQLGFTDRCQIHLRRVALGNPCSDGGSRHGGRVSSDATLVSMTSIAPLRRSLEACALDRAGEVRARCRQGTRSTRG